MAANALALAASTTVTAITLSLTVPARILRVFNPQALRALVTLHKRPKEGAPFDLKAAGLTGMVSAVTSNLCSRDDAVVEVASRIDALDPADLSYLNKAKGLTSILDVLKGLSDTATSHVRAAGEGALSYTLAKLSVVTCGTATQSFDLNVHDYERTPESSSSGTGRFAASLTRPKSFSQAVALLNHFCLVACATGVASFLALSPFLDDVFYEPVRAGELAWPTAFECIISYLSLLENHPSQYTLASVVARLGGQDSIRSAALTRAQGLYAAQLQIL